MVSDIHNYFEYIIKNNEIVTSILPIRIYVNKRGNRTGNYLHLLTLKMMKCLKITKVRLPMIKMMKIFFI